MAGVRTEGCNVTMKDIARIAGVSQSTVSRILNDTPVSVPVSQKTRERVLAAAEEHGYRPNPLARALRGAPTMLVGAIVRDMTDPFFAVAVDALASAAKTRGYSVVLGHARSRADDALALAAMLESRHCDAILLVGDFHEQPLIDDLRRSRIPVVALWHGVQSHGFHSVNVDNVAGIRLALGHLVGLGHTRIGLVGGAALGDIREREAAFRDAAVELGLSLPDGNVQRVENTFAAAGPALDRLLGQTSAPTAVVASTDVLAIGLLHAAAELGVRVPDDLSVVGFDDIPFAAATVPSLTTVHMPVTEMCGAALEIAVTVDRSAPPEARTFEPALVVRASTR
jgi:DNA-binding LacI/PurR family transcriptional regulator